MFSDQERKAELERRRVRNLRMGETAEGNRRAAERELAERQGVPCVHCGNHFLPHQSVAGEDGLCEVCLG